MMMRITEHLTIRFIAAVTLSGSMAIPAGCAINGSSRAGARDVALAEFSRPVQNADRRNDIRDRSESVEPRDGQSGALDVADRADEPMSPPSGRLPQLGAGPVSSGAGGRSIQPGASVIVDSLVGAVNGRPIYADAFFEPIEDLLRALARQVRPHEFEAEAREVIGTELNSIVINELVIADARAQLTPQERQGLFGMIQTWREMTIAEGGGTATGATRRLQDEEGTTIDELLALRRDMALVENLRQRRIRPRVIVSWRDIEREYQRRYREFNPPAEVRVARITLFTQEDAELIEQVKERLGENEDFATVAESLGFPDGGFWQRFTVTEDGIVGLDNEEIRRRLVELQAGETSEPFEVGQRTQWLHVVELRQPERRSLYDPDVQRMLTAQIENRRSMREWNRYLSTLFADGVQEEFANMLDRLMVIAIDRYAPR